MSGVRVSLPALYRKPLRWLFFMFRAIPAPVGVGKKRGEGTLRVAVRKIYKLPKYEKFLRKKSAPVKKVTRDVRNLVRDLMDTLDTLEGVGLAAPQIGVHSRVALVVVG